MNRKLAVALGLSLVIVISPLTPAQTPDFAGAWAGVMNRPAGPAGLETVLAHEGETWRAAMKMRVPAGELRPTVEELKINGSEVTFKAVINGVVIHFTGKFAGDQLNGTFESFRGEAKMGAGTFALTRGGQMASIQQAQGGQGGGQMADPDFDARVAKPAYTKDGPRVLFDEAHNNFHTTTGRYKPFADLITNDGYQITPNKQKFSAETLKGFDILVISNALGAERMGAPDASNPAFSDAECDAVRDWVKGGGALLLIADHAPMGAANQILAQRFGVDMRSSYTNDSANHDKETGSNSFLVYTRDNGLLIDHPTTKGREVSERINIVMTFTGQSLKGPAGSVAFLKLADTAMDVPAPSQADIQAAIEKAKQGGQSQAPLPGGMNLPPGATAVRVQPSQAAISAAGRAQGLVFGFGKGRVVVLGEAAMLSAQLTGPGGTKFGMNRPGIDNRQLALNIVHWLSGLLK
jgi:hypothetical protein